MAAGLHGLVVLAVLAMGTLATHLLGQATRWHAGIILVMWLGIMVSVITYLATTSLGEGTNGRRAGRVAAQILSLASLAMAMTATATLGLASHWHAGIILTTWLGIMTVNIAYAVFVAAMADQKPGASRR